MQRLIFASREDEVKTDAQINVGLIRPIESPFNLFLNFEQLVDYEKRYVYFFVYSIGKRKVMLWGVYDKQNQDFIVDGGCKYKPIQLKVITDTWSRSGYKYVSNTVSDRITPTIANYLGNELMTYQDYVDKKRLLRYLTGKLDHKAMVKEYGKNFLFELLPEQIDPTDENELGEYVEQLSRELTSYEELINRTDIDEGLLSVIGAPIRKMLIKITKLFDQALQDNKFYSDEYDNLLDACPDLERCRVEGGKSCSVYTFGSDRDRYDDDVTLDFT